MSVFDPSEISRSERKRIFDRARRNVSSEVTVILTAGFALVMILLFFFGNFTFLPLAEYFQLRPTIVWIVLSLLISGTFGLVHSWLASKRVAQAGEQQSAKYKFDEAKRRSETEEKINILNKKAP